MKGNETQLRVGLAARVRAPPGGRGLAETGAAGRGDRRRRASDEPDGSPRPRGRATLRLR